MTSFGSRRGSDRSTRSGIPHLGHTVASSSAEMRWPQSKHVSPWTVEASGMGWTVRSAARSSNESADVECGISGRAREGLDRSNHHSGGGGGNRTFSARPPLPRHRTNTHPETRAARQKEDRSATARGRAREGLDRSNYHSGGGGGNRTFSARPPLPRHRTNTHPETRAARQKEDRSATARGRAREGLDRSNYHSGGGGGNRTPVP